MKSAKKVWIIVGSVVLLLGILVLFGGLTNRYLRRIDWDNTNIRSPFRYLHNRYSNDYDYDYDYDYEYDHETGINIGGSENGDIISGDSTELEAFDELKLDIGCGRVNISYGDEFSITARNYDERYYELTRTGNRVELEYDRKGRNNVRDFDKEAAVFDIVLKEGTVLRDFEMNIGATDCEIDGLIAQKVEMEIGAGELNGKNIDFGKLDLNCGAGDVFLEGKIKGNSEISAAVANVELNIIGDVNDYSVGAECAIGSVSVDGEEMGGIASHSRHTRSDAPYTLELKCATGNIEVTFSE